MRYLRIPYHYLPYGLVWSHYVFSAYTLNVIHDIHHDIPNEGWYIKSAGGYMYYPAFMYWVHAKARRAIVARRSSCKATMRRISKNRLKDGVMQLRTKPLSHFIPPKDADLAADVVWLLDYTGNKGDMKLPYSYLELARHYYGNEVNERSHQGIDRTQGSHRDADRDWYYA